MSVEILNESGNAPRTHRPVWPAMKRGMAGKCPSCGQGSLFDGFIKTHDECASCGTELHHHRADDLPAYLVVLVVGHIVVGAAMAMNIWSTLSIWVQLAIWTPVMIISALATLRPAKGAVIGLQWANYMHGFGGDDDKQGYDAT